MSLFVYLSVVHDSCCPWFPCVPMCPDPGVMEELLWFVKGSTDARLLQNKDIHIWDGNSTKEFLEGRGLGHREEGDLGPVYGFQWRHFGAEYKDMHTDYSGEGGIFFEHDACDG